MWQIKIQLRPKGRKCTNAHRAALLEQVGVPGLTSVTLLLDIQQAFGMIEARCCYTED